MPIKYYWGLECRDCGERTLKYGGPRGHGRMTGDCDGRDGHRANHSPVAKFGPSGARRMRSRLDADSYDAVRAKFVEEHISDEELEELTAE